MPHKTQSYPFETKIFEFAGNLARSLAGADRTFVMIFNGTGAVQTIIIKKPSASSNDIKKQLEETKQPHFVYDPFDAPRYTWISWFMIKRSTMERLIGNRFEAADFRKNNTTSKWTPELNAESVFPESWGVMF